LGRAVFGAQRALLTEYNAAATGGYSVGVSVLQHPTGGLLFGTNYYGTNNLASASGFEAFGNNPFASNAVASQFQFGSGFSLSQPLASYVQFGKFIRPISNGSVFGTYYLPMQSNPPFGLPLAPGTFFGAGYFVSAIGSNPLNVGLFMHVIPVPFGSPTFFK
jgi:hypothetical protein